MKIQMPPGVKDPRLSIKSTALDALVSGSGTLGGGNTERPSTALRAMQSATVAACVRAISAAIAPVEFRVSKTTARGKVRSVDHPVNVALSGRVKGKVTSHAVQSSWMAALLLTGNVYELKTGTPKRTTGLVSMPAGDVTPEQQEDGSIKYKVGGGKSYTDEQVLHLRGLSVNGGITGLSVVSALGGTFNLDLEMRNHVGQSFTHGAKLRHVIELPGALESQEDVDRLKDSFDAAAMGENSFKTAVLEGGAKLTPMSMSHTDSQILAARKASSTEIAMIFGVPEPLLGSAANTSAYKSYRELRDGFIIFTIVPWVQYLEKQFTLSLLSEADRKANLTVKGDMTALTRGDWEGRLERFNRMIGMGAMTPNQVCAAEGVPTHSMGDNYYMLQQYIEIKDDAQLDAAPTTTPTLEGDNS